MKVAFLPSHQSFGHSHPPSSSNIAPWRKPDLDCSVTDNDLATQKSTAQKPEEDQAQSATAARLRFSIDLNVTVIPSLNTQQLLELEDSLLSNQDDLMDSPEISRICELSNAQFDCSLRRDVPSALSRT